MAYNLNVEQMNQLLSLADSKGKKIDYEKMEEEEVKKWVFDILVEDEALGEEDEESFSLPDMIEIAIELFSIDVQDLYQEEEEEEDEEYEEEEDEEEEEDDEEEEEEEEELPKKKTVSKKKAEKKAVAKPSNKKEKVPSRRARVQHYLCKDEFLQDGKLRPELYDFLNLWGEEDEDYFVTLDDTEVPTEKVWVKPIMRGITLYRMKKNRKVSIISFDKLRMPVGQTSGLYGELFFTGLKGLQECEDNVVIPEERRWHDFSPNCKYLSSITTEQSIEILTSNEVIEYIDQKGVKINKKADAGRKKMEAKVAEEKEVKKTKKKATTSKRKKKKVSS